jgi:hypothetical protein
MTKRAEDVGWTLQEGDLIAIDGTAGVVTTSDVPFVDSVRDPLVGGRCQAIRRSSVVPFVVPF